MVATQQSPWWQKTTGGAYPTATPSLAWNPYRDAQQQAIQPQQQQASLPTYAGMDGAAQPAGSWWQNRSAPATTNQQAQTSGSGFAKLAGTGATAGAQAAAGGVGTGGTASSQSADGFTQGSGEQFQTTDYASNTTTGGNDWYNKIPEWTRGGGYPIGYDYNQQTKQWSPKGTQAAGTLIGDEVGWHTGLYLPAAYNPAGDTSSFQASTGAEKANARAIRQTADYMRANPTANAQHYFEYVLANLVRDQGTATGYDPSQFAATTYGEAYDPNKTYMAKGVSNPYTGKQAGNAGGQDTTGQASATTTTTGNTGGTTTTTTGGGGGKYDPLAIKAAESDQRMGFDMLMQYLTGSNKEGTGPFSGFMESFLGPIATALINAKGAANGQTPTNIDDIFASIKSGIGGGAQSNLYDYMGNMARTALAKQLGGGDVSFDEAQQATSLYSPLLTRGFNPIAQKQYTRQLGDTLRGMQAPSYTDMVGNNNGNYGGQLAGSQFYRNWWQ